ncbi:MAG: acylphosphatase, partial [Bacteroidetes bacterium]|nr:acylphosphatase [Bacteroidota bacterium]
MKERLHMVVRGAVQGVGFRPFIHRLASEMHLNGYVLNAPEGVFIEAESEKNTLDEFVTR